MPTYLVLELARKRTILPLCDNGITLQKGSTVSSLRGEGVATCNCISLLSSRGRQSLTFKCFYLGHHPPWFFSVPHFRGLVFSVGFLVLPYVLVLFNIGLHKICYLHRVDFTAFTMTDLKKNK